MIKVTFTESGEKLSLRLEGHAGYAEIGNDIVCASASILAYTTAHCVKVAEQNGDLVSPAEIRLDSGDTLFSCEPTEDTWLTIQDLYFFAKMGYTLLAQNYPQYVRLNTLT